MGHGGFHFCFLLVFFGFNPKRLTPDPPALTGFISGRSSSLK